MLFILKEIVINDTTDAPKWDNYLDLHLQFDEDGKRFTRLYDKRDDFDFPIFNFPYLISNIPEFPAYGVFGCFTVDTLCVCSKYEDFLIKVIEAGIFLTETSDYFSEMLWSSYRPCS